MIDPTPASTGLNPSNTDWLPFVTLLVTNLTVIVVSIINNRRIKVVHSLINSRLTELIQVSSGLARAEGFKDGEASLGRAEK